MRTLIPAVLAFIALSTGAAPAGAGGGMPLGPSNRVLDTAYVHKTYLNGDFDKAIHLLEVALKYDKDFSHSDSVFAFKHLGVMYAAKYETREKGKLFMMKLLETEPTARIMDMYASDMIYMIFKNIQDEFEMSQAKVKRAKSHVDGNAQKEPPKAKAELKAPRSYAWIYWTGGALALVGGGIFAYHLVSEDEAGTRERVIE